MTLNSIVQKYGLKNKTEEEFAEEKPYYSSFYASERVSLRPDLIENTF